MSNPDLVIVGAGPVGLLSACHMATLFKHNNLDKKIVVVEKYPKYQRTHTLSVEGESIQHDKLDPQLEAELRKFVGRTRTSKIEDSLKAFAVNAGVEFEYTEVESCEALAKRYSNAEIFIGADGAHSIIRKQVFGDKFEKQRDHQYVLQVTYETENPTKPLSFFKKSINFITGNHLVNEFIKSTEDGSAVSLQIVLNEDEYKALAFAKAKDNIGIDDPKIPKNVKLTIDNWIKAREYAYEDKIKKNSAKISDVKLSSYMAEKAVEKTDYQGNGKQQTWILCGDSFCGVPYFRSLNNGWICALNLGYSLSLYFQGQQYPDEPMMSSSSSAVSELKPQDPLEQYEWFAKKSARSEIRNARLKAGVYHAADMSFAGSRAMSHSTAASVEYSSSSFTSLYDALSSSSYASSSADATEELGVEKSGCTIC